MSVFVALIEQLVSSDLKTYLLLHGEDAGKDLVHGRLFRDVTHGGRSGVVYVVGGEVVKRTFLDVQSRIDRASLIGSDEVLIEVTGSVGSRSLGRGGWRLVRV